jgi:phosphoenolpyruvate carboxylase
MDRLSADAFAAYRALAYETPNFRSFFRAMTPIAEIATLEIGLRPASRIKSDAIEDLRAIPCVFSWAQARVMLPGWFGLHAAASRFKDVGAAARDGAGWAVFCSNSGEHGNGAGEVRHGYCGALCRAGACCRWAGDLSAHP